MPIPAIFSGGIGVPELMIVLVLVLILFGAGRLPQVLGSLGKGIKSFRDAQKDEPLDVSRSPKEIPKSGEVQEAEEIREKHYEV